MLQFYQISKKKKSFAAKFQYIPESKYSYLRANNQLADVSRSKVTGDWLSHDGHVGCWWNTCKLLFMLDWKLAACQRSLKFGSTLLWWIKTKQNTTFVPRILWQRTGIQRKSLFESPVKWKVWVFSHNGNVILLLFKLVLKHLLAKQEAFWNWYRKPWYQNWHRIKRIGTILGVSYAGAGENAAYIR